MNNPNSPVPTLQYQCITTKTSLYEDRPVRLDSPLEAYCCLGRIAKAYKLPEPKILPTLYEMRDCLNSQIKEKPIPREDIGWMIQIMNDLNRDYETDNMAADIIEFSYIKEN